MQRAASDKDCLFHLQVRAVSAKVPWKTLQTLGFLCGTGVNVLRVNELCDGFDGEVERETYDVVRVCEIVLVGMGLRPSCMKRVSSFVPAKLSRETGGRLIWPLSVPLHSTWRAIENNLPLEGSELTTSLPLRCEWQHSWERRGEEP